MSQYGAQGMALKGKSYKTILGHYYTDTEIGKAPTDSIRVILRQGVSSVKVSGARSVIGGVELSAGNDVHRAAQRQRDQVAARIDGDRNVFKRFATERGHRRDSTFGNGDQRVEQRALPRTAVVQRDAARRDVRRESVGPR